MGRHLTPGWIAYARYGVVAALTLLAVREGALSAGGHLLSPSAVAAAVCGVVVLLRPLHWLTAPVIVLIAVGVWGQTLLPVVAVVLFDLAVDGRIAAASGFGVAMLLTNTLVPPANSLDTPRSALFMVVAVAAGQWLGSHQRLVRALNAEVQHLRTERELREQAVRAAERSRIAAEMHDVLAHRLSLIALHTGVLATRDASLPTAVKTERLALLRTASTQALTDLREVLGALRDAHTHSAQPPVAPALPDVHDLIEQAHTAGQHVELTIDGDPHMATTAHQLAVYRLVQEALTNARKHAHGVPVRIHVNYGPPVTVIEVTNAPGGESTNSTSSGYGLVGLRERVDALGGELSAGPDAHNGWRLAARIPHRSHSTTASDA